MEADSFSTIWLATRCFTTSSLRRKRRLVVWVNQEYLEGRGPGLISLAGWQQMDLGTWQERGWSGRVLGMGAGGCWLLRQGCVRLLVGSAVGAVSVGRVMGLMELPLALCRSLMQMLLGLMMSSSLLSFCLTSSRLDMLEIFPVSSLNCGRTTTLSPRMPGPSSTTASLVTFSSSSLKLNTFFFILGPYVAGQCLLIIRSAASLISPSIHYISSNQPETANLLMISFFILSNLSLTSSQAGQYWSLGGSLISAMESISCDIWELGY